jgi:poly(3-hydroxybutyrate) depolymerase
MGGRANGVAVRAAPAGTTAAARALGAVAGLLLLGGVVAGRGTRGPSKAAAEAGAVRADVAGAAAAGGGGAAPAAGRAPAPRFVPRPRGPCPAFAPGRITVRPGGVARDVQIWMSDAARRLDGPLVFYWHATGSSPREAAYGLGAAQIEAIEAQGGIVAAPHRDPAAGTWPWHLVAGTSELDLEVADEVLACAASAVGVDLRRIHAVGMSAGGIQTVQMSRRRSGYLASVAVYSGGQTVPSTSQDPTNRLAALIFHGGPRDVVVGFPFDEESERYAAALTAAGHFALLCDHGQGHRLPIDAAPGVWRFLQDHPFGTDPSPYVEKVPELLPAYCAR